MQSTVLFTISSVFNSITIVGHFYLEKQQFHVFWQFS